MMITGTPEEQAATRKRILNRLRRAQGQLGGVIAAMEAGGSCREVVTQLAAVTSALDRAGFAIISSAMRDCVVDPEAAEAAEGLTAEELEKLFLSLA
jgi:DNA-binding FrmR family transcriptional regulator